MVDLHSHILWGIDDGAKDREMSLNMIKQAIDGGTKTIVATPHYLRDRYDVKYTELHKHFEELKCLIKEEDLNIEVILGQEVYYTEKILDMYNNKEIGTINNSKYMLVELPMSEFDSEEVINNLYELQVRGITVIIAHPERYKPFINNPMEINRFISEGYLFQLNVGSISGEFGKDVQKLGKKFLENNIYNLLGSDAHRVEFRHANMRNRLGEIEKINSDAIDVFNDSGRALIHNEDVFFEGRKIQKEKKGFLSFFKK